MNCAECQTDPLTPGHYCPCCGRKLSLEELRALDANVPAPAPVRPRVIVTKPSDPTPVVAQKTPALETTREATLPPPVVNTDEIKKARAKAVADMTAQAHLAKAANPAPVVRRPIAPPAPLPQRHSYTPMLMMAAAVIVGVIGAAEGARRFGFEWPGRDVRQAAPVDVTASVESVTPPERRATRRDTPSAAKAVPTKVVRPAARPKSNTTAGQRATRPAAAAAARRPAPPTGKFFESNDVDEPPRIASRVAPRLPNKLPAGADKKIAIARVLVSRNGQPHHVSLLRGSMLGRASDEALVAAVAQWTFSPAKKRGEPVNCWYNIGIPLAQAN